MAEEFEKWLHQLDEVFVSSTTDYLDVEEALRIVKRRAASDLKHDDGPDLVLTAGAHRSAEEPPDPASLEKNGSRSTVARRNLILLKAAALFTGFFVLAGICALISSRGNPHEPYAIGVQPQVSTSGSKGTARLALTVSTRKSVSFHYTWQANGSSQPESGRIVNFSGSPKTREFYSPLVSCNSRQLTPVAVVITSPVPSLNMGINGPYGATCHRYQ